MGLACVGFRGIGLRVCFLLPSLPGICQVLFGEGGLTRKLSFLQECYWKDSGGAETGVHLLQVSVSVVLVCLWSKCVFMVQVYGCDTGVFMVQVCM